MSRIEKEDMLYMGSGVVDASDLKARVQKIKAEAREMELQRAIFSVAETPQEAQEVIKYLSSLDWEDVFI